MEINNPKLLREIADEFKTKAGERPLGRKPEAWAKQVETAVSNLLLNNSAVYDAATDILLITSFESRKSYRVNGSCQFVDEVGRFQPCLSRVPCSHRVTKRLAAEYTRRMGELKRRKLDELQAAFLEDNRKHFETLKKAAKKHGAIRIS